MKKNWTKHILTFALIAIYAFLAAGSFSDKKGVKYYKNGEYDKAIEFFKKSTSNGSGDSVAEFWFLGLSYEAVGDYNNAEKYKDKAFKLYQNNSADAKEFNKKYSSDCSELLAYGKGSGFDRTNPASYILKDLKWYEIYGKQMGMGDTNMALVKIPMKIHYYGGGTCEVWDSSNHNTYVNLHWTDTNIGDQLKDLAYNEHAFMAYCEIKSGMLYVNFIDFK